MPFIKELPVRQPLLTGKFKTYGIISLKCVLYTFTFNVGFF